MKKVILSAMVVCGLLFATATVAVAQEKEAPKKECCKKDKKKDGCKKDKSECNKSKKASCCKKK